MVILETLHRSKPRQISARTRSGIPHSSTASPAPAPSSSSTRRPSTRHGSCTTHRCSRASEQASRLAGARRHRDGGRGGRCVPCRLLRTRCRAAKANCRNNQRRAHHSDRRNLHAARREPGRVAVLKPGPRTRRAGRGCHRAHHTHALNLHPGQSCLRRLPRRTKAAPPPSSIPPIIMTMTRVIAPPTPSPLSRLVGAQSLDDSPLRPQHLVDLEPDARQVVERVSQQVVGLEAHRQRLQ